LKKAAAPPQLWSPRAAAKNGPAHTWIGSWLADKDNLRADVTAAGWQWHCVEHIDRDALSLAAVFELFTNRRDRQTSRNTPGEPHVLLALGPGVPWHVRELQLIAFVGRAHDIHLAVSTAGLLTAGRLPRRPADFCDNIMGWYPPRRPADTA